MSEDLTEMLCERIILRQKKKSFDKRKALKSRERELSIVQDHFAYTVMKLESDEEEQDAETSMR